MYTLIFYVFLEARAPQLHPDTSDLDEVGHNSSKFHPSNRCTYFRMSSDATQVFLFTLTKIIEVLSGFQYFQVPFTRSDLYRGRLYRPLNCLEQLPIYLF